ncbi:MotE family protein [Algicella marina]|uniref:Magnesium transporter MgtE intracellular domain-containing protein n=1 Tax=Algicella marina TaxID=2683284 RepID=A0A6P1T244_9RHOB|nr:hypothetical protein [Algicella marina]QHQ36808.1 hypothetical protein GO499_17290 [Algicella marina]
MTHRRIVLRTPPRTHTLTIIVACFAVSGLLRLSIAGVAFGQQLGQTQLAQAESAAPTPDTTRDELLTAIQERDGQLRDREKRLEERLALLRIAEEEFEKRRQALIDAEERLAATLALADDAAEKDIQQLTAVYQNMKPKKAAEVFNTMDPTFAAGFLIRMAPEAAADILTAMDTGPAYTVSVLMASRNMNAPTE